MEFLSNLFGNLATGVIRLAVAVGIIAATYFFLVKPVLDTTDNAINRSFGPGGIGGIQRQINKTINSANIQVQQAVRKSFKQSKTGGHDSQKLLRCVQRANGNVNRMQVCARRF
jgi:maltooligosyltrehalose synthase